MSSKTFTILITTKNRLLDLQYTLRQIEGLLQRENISCIICDDGSVDGTSEFIQKNYPKIHLITHKKSRGYIYNRNLMLGLTKSDFAISFDDDSHFISENPIEILEDYFDQHPECGLIACRIFWNTELPNSTDTKDQPTQVNGFVGCGHVWRMSAWNQIPDYPTWFVFYGEEDFAACQLFKRKIEMHYVPSVLVHHRVDLKARRLQTDYALRLQRSLCSGWNLFFLFFPIARLPRLMGHSIWMQLKLKVFKGDFKAFQALVLASLRCLSCLPKIVRNSNRFTEKEYVEFYKLEDAKIYWRPEN